MDCSLHIPNSTVLVDGNCILCAFTFRFVARRDPQAMFRFAPVQSEFGRRAADCLGIDPRDPSTFVVILDGRVLVRSDGALDLLRRFPGWRWCPVLMWIPRPLRDWVYDRIARNRYRVFSRTNECLVPSP